MCLVTLHCAPCVTEWLKTFVWSCKWLSEVSAGWNWCTRPSSFLYAEISKKRKKITTWGRLLSAPPALLPGRHACLSFFFLFRMDEFISLLIHLYPVALLSAAMVIKSEVMCPNSLLFLTGNLFSSAFIAYAQTLPFLSSMKTSSRYFCFYNFLYEFFKCTFRTGIHCTLLRESRTRFHIEQCRIVSYGCSSWL